AAHRIRKVLGGADTKRASVATDVLGVSGRALLAELIAGRGDPGALAQQARGRPRAKLPQRREAPRGRVTEHHRLLLRLHLGHLAQLGGLTGRPTGRTGGLLLPPPPPGPGGGGSAPGVGAVAGPAPGANPSAGTAASPGALGAA